MKQLTKGALRGAFSFASGVARFLPATKEQGKMLLPFRQNVENDLGGKKSSSPGEMRKNSPKNLFGFEIFATLVCEKWTSKSDVILCLLHGYKNYSSNFA